MNLVCLCTELQRESKCISVNILRKQPFIKRHGFAQLFVENLFAELICQYVIFLCGFHLWF